MDVRGNKLSSCKIPDQYLKKQKSYFTFRTLETLVEKKRKEKLRIQQSCYPNSKKKKKRIQQSCYHNSKEL